MNILLLGATGFIGSNLINNFYSNLPKNVNFFLLKRSPDSTPRVSLLKEHIWVDTIKVKDKKFLKDIDLVVDLSSHSTNPPYHSYDECIYWNVYQKSIFVNDAINAGITNFIFFGSCFEYGYSANNYKFIPENASLKPLNSYSLSKAMFTQYLETFSILNPKIKITLFRLFHVYGNGELKSRLWPSLKKAAESGKNFEISSGEQIRDFIEVTELCEMITLYIKKYFIENYPSDKISNFNTYNLASGKALSVKDFCLRWWKEMNAKGSLKIGKIAYRKNELMRVVADTTNIKKLF